MWLTSQNPHIHRFVLSVVLKMPEHKIRVIAPEVSGGFGSKIPVYPEDALVAFLARELGRPVKWAEDRRETTPVDVYRARAGRRRPIWSSGPWTWWPPRPASTRRRCGAATSFPRGVSLHGARRHQL